MLEVVRNEKFQALSASGKYLYKFYKKGIKMFGVGISDFVIFSILILIPCVINYNLAKSRGKSVPLMIVLTLIFSWIITLILAFLPESSNASGKK